MSVYDGQQRAGLAVVLRLPTRGNGTGAITTDYRPVQHRHINDLAPVPANLSRISVGCNQHLLMHICITSSHIQFCGENKFQIMIVQAARRGGLFRIDTENPAIFFKRYTIVF